MTIVEGNREWGMRYGRVLEDKREEWQNKVQERLNHIVKKREIKKSKEAIRNVITKSKMHGKARNCDQSFSKPV
jgi:hypothetical protein